MASRDAPDGGAERAASGPPDGGAAATDAGVPARHRGASPSDDLRQRLPDLRDLPGLHDEDDGDDAPGFDSAGEAESTLPRHR
jgi:hypothetical protein